MTSFSDERRNRFRFETRLVEYAESSTQPIHELTVSNEEGFTLKCLSYGANILSVMAPDGTGKVEEMTINYRGDKEMDEMLIGKGKNSGYYGCVAGRVANRIHEGKFRLDGEDYNLAVNNGKNCCHGGLEGFDKKIWSWQIICPELHTAGFCFSYTSTDGEEGFPGTVDVDVYYLISTKSELTIRYLATTDRATPINLTNHTYWNLSGDCKRSVLFHKLFSPCSRYTPVDETQIPLGTLDSVTNTPFDFTIEGGVELGKVIPLIDGGGKPGIDHNFVVDGPTRTETLSFDQCGGKGRIYNLRHVATLYDELSGRQMVLHATQPGVQFYSANWLDGEPHSIHKQHNALCLETQHYPDSINQPHFPSCVLRPGERYDHVAIFSFHCGKSSAFSESPQHRVPESSEYILSTSGRESSVRRYRALLSEVLGMNIKYVTYEGKGGKIRPDEFTHLIRSTNCIGAAISKDIKASVISCLDDVDDTASTVQSANTIVKLPNGSLKGFNTDYVGFKIAIRQGIMESEQMVSKVVVYGYGGVVNIVVAALCELNMDVYLCGRRLDEAKRRANELSVMYNGKIKRVNVKLWEDGMKMDMLVNAAPVTERPLQEAANFISAIDGVKVVFDHEMPGKFLKDYCDQHNIYHIPGTSMYYPQMLAQWILFLQDKGVHLTQEHIYQAEMLMER